MQNIISQPASKRAHPSTLDLCHYYLRRLLIHRPSRNFVIACIKLIIGKSAPADADYSTQLAILNRDGILQLNDFLDAEQRREVISYLEDKLIHGMDHHEQRYQIAERPTNMSYGFYDLADVIDCPHILDLVSSAKVVDLATQYLGCAPTLSALGVHWAFPSDTQAMAQKFHRDSEDWKYLRFFIYLNDVDDGSGPHIFIKKSHRDKLEMRLRFYQPDEILKKYGNENVCKVVGPAGTGFAADTSGIHKGDQPRTKARLALTFTFSILRPPLAHYKPVSSRHHTDRICYTNRLFLRK